MFNKYVWDNYLKSGGDKVVELFRSNLTGTFTADYAVQVRRLVSKYCPMKDHLDDVEAKLTNLFTYFNSEEFKSQQSTNAENTPNDSVSDSTSSETVTLDSISAFIDDFFDDSYNCIGAIFERDYHKEPTPQRIFQFFIYDLCGDTTEFFMGHPECFIPYYFENNYNVLQIIADQFEISLPPVPIKKDYEGRFYHYGELCKALCAFRLQNGLSPFELCAFLYDFAPNYIGGIGSYIIDDLPEPRGAFFIGGAKDDGLLADDPSCITLWQCNEVTRAGDMIVMYLRTPVSAVDSIWRACSVGFIDPFFYYYRCTYIGRPKRISAVSQKTLKADQIFGALPIVKKNMQGINGVELLPSEYNHLMDMAEADAFRFECDASTQDKDILLEKDVENKLIMPLLARLGYTENDYTRQLYIEIGNHNHALIPDFVLLPQRAIGHASAFAIIEAKKSIPNEKMLEETKIQARSYANLLQTKYSVIASMEKVWVTSHEDDYSSSIFVAAWQELDNPDVFFRLEKLIGIH